MENSVIGLDRTFHSIGSVTFYADSTTDNVAVIQSMTRTIVPLSYDILALMPVSKQPSSLRQ